jgi:protein TonB
MDEETRGQVRTEESIPPVSLDVEDSQIATHVNHVHRPAEGVVRLILPATAERKQLTSEIARSPREFSPLLARKGKQRRASTLVGSLVAHGLLLGTMLLIPLLFTEAINVQDFARTWLVAPPPPPPPPPPAAAQPLARVRRPSLTTTEGKLKPPASVPKEIAMIRETELPPEGITGGLGVPGGIPGGMAGGVLGGVLASVQALPQAPQPSGPVRAGSELKAPRLLRHVPPVYPPLAQRSRVTGDVRLDARIGPDGRVDGLRVLEGSPLLVQAAMTAVRQWVYEPTILNGRPVEILLEVVVHFQLN